MEKDKILHFVVSLLLCAGGMAAIVYLWNPEYFYIAIFGTALICLAKEGFDMLFKGADSHACFKDLIADAAGIFAGIFVFLLIFFIFK